MQLSRQSIIPTQDVFYPCDLRSSLRRQRRDDQRRAAAQILRAHMCAVQGRNALQPRLPPRKCDGRAEFPQLGDVPEAVFKDRLQKLRPPPRAQQRRHHDGLRVRRKAGVRRGLDAPGRVQRAGACQADRIAPLRDRAAALQQNLDDRLQRPGIGARQLHRAAARRRGAQICGRFDAVGHDGKRRAVQRRAAADMDGAAVLPDLRARAAQKAHQIADLRLARRVFDHRFAVAAHGCEDGVFRGAHACKRQANVPAVQALRAALGKMLPHRHLRAQLPQGEHVQVDGPLSQRAAAGQGDARPPRARQKRPEEQNGRPQPPRILLRHLPAVECARVHDRRAAALLGPAAEAAQNLQCIAHIADVRAVM